MTHKVTTFMLRNPPTSPQEGAAAKTPKVKKSEGGDDEGDSPDENGTSVRNGPH